MMATRPRSRIHSRHDTTPRDSLGVIILRSDTNDQKEKFLIAFTLDGRKPYLIRSLTDMVKKDIMPL